MYKYNPPEENGFIKHNLSRKDFKEIFPNRQLKCWFRYDL